jgi:periodic tryptophan protein 2
MTDAGPLQLLDNGSDSDDATQKDILPGATKRGGETGARSTRNEVRTKSIQFSPTGQVIIIYSMAGSGVLEICAGVFLVNSKTILKSVLLT